MRLVVTVLLWLLTTAALAVAVPAMWAQRTIVDADGYAALARRAANDPALQSAVAAELSTEAMTFITRESGPGSGVDSSLVHRVATGYTAGPSFPAQFAQVNRLVHDRIFTEAGERSAQGGALWVVDLAPMLTDSSFRELFADAGIRVPSTATVPLTVVAPPAVRPGDVRRLAAWSPWVSIGSAVLTGTFALLTLIAARRRGKVLAGLGVSALLVGAGGWAAIEIGRRYLDHALTYTAGNLRRIADVMIAHAVGGLHRWLDITLAAGGVLVLLGVVFALLGGLRKT